MFEQEVQKQLLPNIFHYNYRISWLLQVQIWYSLTAEYLATASNLFLRVCHSLKINMWLNGEQ